MAETEFSKALANTDLINAYNAHGSSRTFLNVDTNLSLRSEYNRADYYSRRKSESIPKTVEGRIEFSMKAYKKVGIVRNVIDLMADFGSQGIKLVHPNKQVERFYQRWFEKVNGVERSERFLNYLFRTGNPVIRRINGKVTSKVEREWKKVHGKEEEDVTLPKSKRRLLPIRYVFHNPLSIELIGGELAAFVGKPIFGLRVSKSLASIIRQAALVSSQGKNKVNKKIEELLSKIPDNIRKAIENGTETILLDEDKISVYHYKKDDWQSWAEPLIAAILDDLVILEKLKLADISALDGAISNIRLWTLGNLEHKIAPNKAAIERLSSLLAGNVGGGTIDLVWGPELTFSESESKVYEFLGPEKYMPHLNAIYDGLGIPPTLTAAAGNTSSGTGFTNNFISLKTLIERLEYGRDLLVNFWKQEIKLVQNAMGFRFPAQVHFEGVSLSDENAEKQLLIQMADRDLISVETLHERFNILPDIEKLRINKESKLRGTSIPDKAGPFHIAEKEHELKKTALQGNHITVDQLPELDLKPSNQKIQEIMDKNQVENTNQSPNPDGGRPKNSKDKQKRKQKRVVPISNKTNSFLNLFIWSQSALDKVSDLSTPALLSAYNKSNLRQLSRAESKQYESIKFNILSNIKPFQDIDNKLVYNIMKSKSKIDADVLYIAKTLAMEFLHQNGREPNIDELRKIQCTAYAINFCEELE